jgi:D-alanyl-D-alanine carboxypeptidase/D-alanyl-D-alanine-endopeptidase (penicillin-binding protein 4)
MKYYFLLGWCGLWLTQPLLAQNLQSQAHRILIDAPGFDQANVGICLYDPGKHEYLYRHNDRRYFTPASNTKLLSLYAGLCYLGDSTSGIQYQLWGDTLYIRGTGDPSVLHPDFAVQPVWEFLTRQSRPIVLTEPAWETLPYGPGWAWDDFQEAFQPERSAMPLYGNVARFLATGGTLTVIPEHFAGDLVSEGSGDDRAAAMARDPLRNVFYFGAANGPSFAREVPFLTSGPLTAALWADTLHKPVLYRPGVSLPGPWKSVANVPLDSLLQIMMHRSDNFFAEQTDLMVSARLFDTLSTSRIIAYLLEEAFRNLPDTPRWVDGSGLSRYNLFTPRDLVAVLAKLYGEFSSDRLDAILPTGGQGTLAGLYHDMAGAIFAKTGSLSNNQALSGRLVTRKGHILLFSIMVGNCLVPSRQISLAMERFLRFVWETQ